MPALAVVADNGAKPRSQKDGPNPALQNYRRVAKWAKPMPKTHKNWIPPQKYIDYNWKDDIDPDLLFALYAIEQSGWTLEEIEEATEKAGKKVSRYCLLGWFYKGVRRPQNATISIVCSVLGWERHWTQG